MSLARGSADTIPYTAQTQSQRSASRYSSSSIGGGGGGVERDSRQKSNNMAKIPSMRVQAATEAANLFRKITSGPSYAETKHLYELILRHCIDHNTFCTAFAARIVDDEQSWLTVMQNLFSENPACEAGIELLHTLSFVPDKRLSTVLIRSKLSEVLVQQNVKVGHAVAMLQACIGNGGDIEFLVKRTQVPQKLVAAFVRCPDSESEIALLQLVSSLLSGLPTCASDLRDGDVDKCVLRVGFKHAAACEGKSVDILRLCVFCARHFARANRRRNAYLDSVFIFCSHAIRILETDVSELLADVCQLLVRYDFYEEHPTLFVSVVAASPFVRLRHSAVLQFVDNVVLHVPTALAPEYASRACSAGQLLCDPSAVDLALPLLCLLQRCVDIVGYKELSALLSFTLLRDCRNTILAKGDSGGKRAFAMFMLGFPLNECYPAGLAHFWTPISWLVSHTVLTPADYHKAFNAEYDSAAAATFDNRVASILKTHIGQLQQLESAEERARPEVHLDEAEGRAAVESTRQDEHFMLSSSKVEELFQTQDLPVLVHMQTMRGTLHDDYFSALITRRESHMTELRSRRKAAMEAITSKHRLDPREVAFGEQEMYEQQTRVRDLLQVEKQKYAGEIDKAKLSYAWMLQQGRIFADVTHEYMNTMSHSSLYALELKEELMRGCGWYGIKSSARYPSVSVLHEEEDEWLRLRALAQLQLPLFLSSFVVEHMRTMTDSLFFEESFERLNVECERHLEYTEIREKRGRNTLAVFHRRFRISARLAFAELLATYAHSCDLEASLSYPQVSPEELETYSRKTITTDEAAAFHAMLGVGNLLSEETQTRNMIYDVEHKLAWGLLGFFEKLERAQLHRCHALFLIGCDIVLREVAERECIYASEARMRVFWEEQADPSDSFVTDLLMDFYSRDYIEKEQRSLTMMLSLSSNSHTQIPSPNNEEA